MFFYLENCLHNLRPAFSRRATFLWFGVILLGVMGRSDNCGVSSIVRALCLDPACYPSLLHFFHSPAWSTATLWTCWRDWLSRQNLPYTVGERLVLIADHTKTPKDGRRIPAVQTLHQDSETASKPSAFRGHQWGCIALLSNIGQKFCAIPGEAEIHPAGEALTSRLIHRAAAIAAEMGKNVYLVLDAYFAVGPVFRAAAQSQGRVQILTRAKKNIIAYLPLPAPLKRPPGRPARYGIKLPLKDLFDTEKNRFHTASAPTYQQNETVRYLVRDLFWKPTGGLLRFFLCETSRGRIILMSSDLQLEPLTALFLYCRRSHIETLFDSLKNILGGMGYHFWSKYLAPVSRRPAKRGSPPPLSIKPEKTRNTLAAIEKFLLVHLVALGIMQLLAHNFARPLFAAARCWLRTPNNQVPSEFVTKIALGNLLRDNLGSFGNNGIIRLIRAKQKKFNYDEDNLWAA